MEIIRIHTKKKSLDGDVGLGKLVDLTEGWTGTDISNMVNTAALSAIREHISADSKFGHTIRIHREQVKIVSTLKIN